jgi:excisionase family DNA binding protein
MTLSDVASRLHCSVRTVRRRIADGQLRASHLGRGLWVIREEDLNAYLDTMASRPREPAPLPPVRPVRTNRQRPAATFVTDDGRLIITSDMGRN